MLELMRRRVVDVPPRTAEQVLRCAQHEGYLMFVVDPPRSGIHFAFCFIQAPTPLYRGEGERGTVGDVCSLFLTAKSPVSAIVQDSTVVTWPVGHHEQAVRAAVERFCHLAGTSREWVLEALGVRPLIIERNQPVVLSKMTKRGWWALGEVAAHARGLRITEGALSRVDVIFRDKLASFLADLHQRLATSKE
jgi:hypothetical protein